MVEIGVTSEIPGLQRSNPFLWEECDFQETMCILGPWCSTSGVTYSLKFKSCDPKVQPATGDPGAQEKDAEGEGPRRYQYVGLTGTTAHCRMLAHLEKNGSVVHKHQEEYHQGIQEVHSMEVKVNTREHRW